MQHYVWILIGLFLFKTAIAADFNYLENDQQKIVYVDLDGQLEVSAFVEMFHAGPSKFEIETLIINNYDGKKDFILLVGALKGSLLHLKRLWFLSNNGKKKKGLGIKPLIKVMYWFSGNWTSRKKS